MAPFIHRWQEAAARKEREDERAAREKSAARQRALTEARERQAASRVLAEQYGAQSILPVSALAGLADVDAVTVTVGRAASTGLDLRLCALAVLVAGAVDSVSKSVITAFVGDRKFAVLYSSATALSLGLAALTAPWS